MTEARGSRLCYKWLSQWLKKLESIQLKWQPPRRIWEYGKKTGAEGYRGTSAHHNFLIWTFVGRQCKLQMDMTVLYSTVNFNLEHFKSVSSKGDLMLETTAMALRHSQAHNAKSNWNNTTFLFFLLCTACTINCPLCFLHLYS